MSALTIRSMSVGEVQIAVDWAAAEGWNPGLDDAAAFHATDPDGFRMAFMDGEPVACISVVRYGEDYAFLGFYICRPELRGRGIGYALWQDSLEWLGARTVGLDGVPDQQPNYRKSGFVLAHRNIRHGGEVAADEGRGDDKAVLPIDGSLAGKVAAYDTGCFGRSRERFLEQWLTPTEARQGYALVEDDALKGYAVLRRCGEGYKIGPLFADDEQVADRLFRRMAADAAGQDVFLDTPEPNEAAVRLAVSHGLKPVFETARMYRGPVPDLPLDRIYGITTFELG